jgi:hypothetical protein
MVGFDDARGGVWADVESEETAPVSNLSHGLPRIARHTRQRRNDNRTAPWRFDSGYLLQIPKLRQDRKFAATLRHHGFYPRSFEKIRVVGGPETDRIIEQ